MSLDPTVADKKGEEEPPPGASTESDDSVEYEASPWSSRFRFMIKALIFLVIFIVYAGYSHRSGSDFGGEPTFVNSPGFIKFSQSSGISGLVHLASGMWGKALGIEQPPPPSPEEAPKEAPEEIVEVGIDDEEIIEELAVEAPFIDVIKDQEPSDEAPKSMEKNDIQCAEIPDVPWWTNKSYEESVKYVDSKYNGNWELYLAKWERHLTKVIDVYVAGKKIKIKDTTLIGEDLADYVNQIEERISIIHCFSRNAL